MRALSRPTAGRVLVVDDEPDIARLVEVCLLADGYDIAIAHGGEEAIETAVRFRPDLVVLDVMMPGRDGLEVCRALRNDPRTAAASIIMLTARTQPHERVSGLTVGADDYVAKPFHPDELAARVRSSLRRARQLRAVSPLTGMAGNFDIARELEMLTRPPVTPFALVHADLDYFKAFNDHYGFVRGDEAIRATANVIETCLAGAHTEVRFAGHVGGDDFALLVDPAAVGGLCDAIVEEFDRVAPTLYDEADRARGYIEVEDRRGNIHRFSVLTVSLGVVTSLARDLRSPSEASTIANEMKQLAKSIPGSVWKLDRRKG